MLNQKLIFNSQLLYKLQLCQAKERKYFIYVTEKCGKSFNDVMRNSICTYVMMSTKNYLGRFYHVHNQRKRIVFAIAVQMFPAMKMSP